VRLGFELPSGLGFGVAEGKRGRERSSHWPWVRARRMAERRAR
jgi:hypothetical protein